MGLPLLQQYFCGPSEFKFFFFPRIFFFFGQIHFFFSLLGAEAWGTPFSTGPTWVSINTADAVEFLLFLTLCVTAWHVTSLLLPPLT